MRRLCLAMLLVSLAACAAPRLANTRADVGPRPVDYEATIREHLHRVSARHNYLFTGGELTQLTLDIPFRRATRAARGMIRVSNA